MKDGIVELMTRLYVSLPDLGSISSIVGLATTLFVFYKIRRLEAHFLLTARIPEHIEQLREHRKQILKLLSSFDESLQDIRMELANCEANLKSLKRKLHGEERKSVSKLVAFITRQRKSVNRPSKDQLWRILQDLAAVTQGLVNLQEDEKWRH